MLAHMVTERAKGQKAGGFEILNHGSVVQPECGRSRNPPAPPLYHQPHSHLIYTHTFTTATINYLCNIPTSF